MGLGTVEAPVLCNHVSTPGGVGTVPLTVILSSPDAVLADLQVLLPLLGFATAGALVAAPIVYALAGTRSIEFEPSLLRFVSIARRTEVSRHEILRPILCSRLFGACEVRFRGRTGRPGGVQVTRAQARAIEDMPGFGALATYTDRFTRWRAPRESDSAARH